MSSPYRAIIGFDAAYVRPNDRAYARRRVLMIRRALDDTRWSPNERRKLYFFHRRWQRRAEGEDARFFVVGTRRGRVSKADARRIAERQSLINLQARRAEVA